MDTQQFRLGFERKIGYSFAGLAAANLASLVTFLICEALGLIPAGFVPAASWRYRLLHVLGLAILFGIVSMVSWVVIGLPVVLSLSANLTARLHWSLAAMLGAVLGAIPYALLCVLVDGWQRTAAGIRNSQIPSVELTFLAVAAVIGCVAFSVYCLLVRRASYREQRKSGAPSSAPQSLSVF